MDSKELFSQARIYRSKGRFEEAYQLVLTAASTLHDPRVITWEHHPIFWSDITAGICRLTPRKGSDAIFIKELWSNQDFVYRFHRNASEIPQNKKLLEEILEREFISPISESKSLHWIVRDKDSMPWGLLSLSEISLMHKRAEVLLGVLPGAPAGLSVAAMLILFNFFFKAMKFNKLYSLIYEDNPHSLKSTLHLGFKKEGLLRNHAIDPKSATYMDLIQTGCLAVDAFNQTTNRLMERLLK